MFCVIIFVYLFLFFSLFLFAGNNLNILIITHISRAFYCLSSFSNHYNYFAQSAGAVEYTDCTSAEG